MMRDKPTQTMRGAAALSAMLDSIGGIEGDHEVAKVLVENETELRELLKFALHEFAISL